MRINPGWLKRKIRQLLAQVLGQNKLGVQCQEKGKAVYRYNKEVRPNSIKAINIVDKDFWQRIWDENPRLQYAIYRECGNGPDPWDDPEGKAMAWVNYLKGKIGHLVEAGLVNVVEGYNEWIHSFQEKQFPAADRFMAALISETHRQFEGKVHIIVLNASCGHFSHDIVKFPKTLTALNQCPKCMLGLHEYDRESMDRTAPFRCGKFQLVEEALEAAGYDNVSIAITELGLDDSVDRPVGSPHRGWRHYGATVEEAAAHFLDNRNLAWYYPLLMASDRVKLASIFGCQMYDKDNWGEWGFDIAHGFPMLLDGIRNLETSPPDPPPPNGGNDMEEDLKKIKVFALVDGKQVELTSIEDKLKLVRDKYGAEFRRAEVASGQKVYRLVELWEKTGHSSLITQVLNEGGSPMANVDVAFYWPDAPDPPDPPTVVYGHDWHKRFKHGSTNANGDVGPGMGPGAYHGEGEGGPHAVWVRDPTIPTDICEKLGMLAGTNHDHLDQKFQLVVHEGEEPPPPPGGGTLKFKERLVSPHDANMLGIAIPPDYAVEQDARGDFEGPGIDEPPIHPKEWIYSDGTRMALMEGCANFNGAETEIRNYAIRVFNLRTDEYITDKQSEPFNSLESGVSFGRVIYVYELVDDEEPPQPPPDGAPEELRQMAADLRQKADRMDDLADNWGSGDLTVNLNGKEVGKGKQLTVSVD